MTDAERIAGLKATGVAGAGDVWFLIMVIGELEVKLRLANQVPGTLFCPKCRFVVHRNILYAKSGNIGVDSSPTIEACPNDGELMRPMTWQEDQKMSFEAFKSQVDRCMKLETDQDELKTTLRHASVALTHYGEVCGTIEMEYENGKRAKDAVAKIEAVLKKCE